MNALVDSARALVGTRYRHRGRSGHAVDCAGLVWLAYSNAGITLPDYRHYGREPHRDGLVHYVTLALGDPLPMSTPLVDGDVLLLRFDVEPHHMAVVADAVYGCVHAFNIIHADGHLGRVVEQRFTPDMLARVTHIFRRAV